MKIASLSALLLFSLALGCGEPSAPAAPAAAPEAVAAVPAPAAVEDAPAADKGPLTGDAVAGKEVFATNCVACHQADGKGMGGALGADLVNDKARSAKTNAQLRASIADGVEGTTMIGWSAVLNETQIDDVLAYVRTEFMK